MAYEKFDLSITNSKLNNLDSGLPSQFDGKLVELCIIRTEINLSSAFEKLRKSNTFVSALKTLLLYEKNLNEIP